jgi:hypothetical protein
MMNEKKIYKQKKLEQLKTAYSDLKKLFENAKRRGVKFESLNNN